MTAKDVSVVLIKRLLMMPFKVVKLVVEKGEYQPCSTYSLVECLDDDDLERDLEDDELVYCSVCTTVLTHRRCLKPPLSGRLGANFGFGTAPTRLFVP